MNFKQIKSALVATALMVAASGAQAGFVISGGSAGTIGLPTDNDLLAPLGLSDPLGGYFASEILLSGDVDNVYATLLGYEAAFDNEFWFDGVEIFDKGTDTSVVSTPSAEVDLGPALAGSLDFTFLTREYTDDGPIFGSVDNGDPNTNTPGVVNFFASCYGDPTGTTCNRLLLFMDDGGSPGDDDNHDDLVVLLRVPEPTTLALLGLGLIGLGYSRKRA